MAWRMEGPGELRRSKKSSDRSRGPRGGPGETSDRGGGRWPRGMCGLCLQGQERPSELDRARGDESDRVTGTQVSWPWGARGEHPSGESSNRRWETMR